jgi:hypothetical protein
MYNTDITTNQIIALLRNGVRGSFLSNGNKRMMLTIFIAMMIIIETAASK